MIRILHLADLHLGRSHSYLADKAEERRKEADGLLRRIVEKVLGDPIEADAVVIAGDLFESYKPADTLVGEVLRDLRRLVDAGKTVITLPGNHDELSYHQCVYRKHQDRWPGILVTSPHWSHVMTLDTEDGPCHFYGIAYQAGETSDTLEDSLPLKPEGLHVAVLHAAVDLPGKDRSIQARSKDLGNLGVDYVALGHVHKPGRYSLSRGIAVYPGSIEGSGFDDPGCRELTVVSLRDGEPKIEKVPIDARCIETRDVDLGRVDGPDALRTQIQRMADGDLILRIRLVGAAGFAPETSLICAELGGGFYHLEIEEDLALMEAADVDAAAGEETPLAFVIRALREKEREAKTEEEKVVARLALQHAWKAWRGH